LSDIRDSAISGNNALRPARFNYLGAVPKTPEVKRHLALLIFAFGLAGGARDAAAKKPIPQGVFKFRIEHPNCKVKIKEPGKAGSNFDDYSKVLPKGSMANGKVNPKNVQETQFKIVSRPDLKKFVFSGRTSCLLPDIELPSNDEVEVDAELNPGKKTAKRAPRGFYVALGYAGFTEKQFFVSSSGQDQLKSANVGGALGLGYEKAWSPWANAGFQWDFVGYKNKTSNAAAQPSFSFTTTAIVLGSTLTPSYLINASFGPSFFMDFGLGLPIVLRYQKFPTSTDGAVSAKAFRTMFGTTGIFRLGFGKFRIGTSVGLVFGQSLLTSANLELKF
jgi:hypothetical protein